MNDSNRVGIQVSLSRGFPNNLILVAGIMDNESNENTDDGIFIGSNIPGSGATLISGNQTNNNDEDGIDIDSSGYVVLANEANNNTTGAGIDADDAGAGANVDGGGNTASGNGSCNTPGCF